MKKILSLFLAFVLVFSMTACASNGNEATNNENIAKEPQKIKFSQSVAELKKYDGQVVTINGFMSLLSPLDGSLIYLMNVPFQSCPFCIPNTNTLSNTIAVDGSDIEFTIMPVKITGKLVFGEFDDGYGYDYEYRIEDAKVTVMDEAEASEKVKVYYTVAQEDYIGELFMIIDWIWSVGYYEEIELTAEHITERGYMMFDRYNEIKTLIESLNANGEYNSFLDLLTSVEEVRVRAANDIENGNVEAYTSYQSEADELFEKFYAFINEHEF
jgi:hypothetical protein